MNVVTVSNKHSYIFPQAGLHFPQIFRYCPQLAPTPNGVHVKPAYLAGRCSRSRRREYLNRQRRGRFALRAAPRPQPETEEFKGNRMPKHKEGNTYYEVKKRAFQKTFDLVLRMNVDNTPLTAESVAHSSF
jgi:hypothetical protein